MESVMKYELTLDTSHLDNDKELYNVINNILPEILAELGITLLDSTRVSDCINA